MSDSSGLVQILEAALFAAGKPLTAAHLLALFEDHERPGKEDVQAALVSIGERCEGRGYELVEVASGFRFQVREQFSTWVGRLWQERPQKYSRALLETLALIAYRQPITRGEIEEIRGVAVSTNIMRTLQERDWIRVVGHRDVPGRPAMYATTRQFLDYFNLKSLDQLPALAETRDLDTLNAELGFSEPLPDSAQEDEEDGAAQQADADASLSMALQPVADALESQLEEADKALPESGEALESPFEDADEAPAEAPESALEDAAEAQPEVLQPVSEVPESALTEMESAQPNGQPKGQNHGAG